MYTVRVLRKYIFCDRSIRIHYIFVQFFRLNDFPKLCDFQILVSNKIMACSAYSNFISSMWLQLTNKNLDESWNSFPSIFDVVAATPWLLKRVYMWSDCRCKMRWYTENEWLSVIKLQRDKHMKIEMREIHRFAVIKLSDYP